MIGSIFDASGVEGTSCNPNRGSDPVDNGGAGGAGPAFAFAFLHSSSLVSLLPNLKVRIDPK